MFDPQPSQNTLQNRNITFNLPHYSEEDTQNETQENIQNETQDTIQENTQHEHSIRNTSVNVLSPTRNASNDPRYMTRSTYDPPSFPSAFQSNRSINQMIIKTIINLLLVVIIAHLIIHFSQRQTILLIQITIQIIPNQISIQEYKIHL